MEKVTSEISSDTRLALLPPRIAEQLALVEQERKKLSLDLNDLQSSDNLVHITREDMASGAKDLFQRSLTSMSLDLARLRLLLVSRYLGGETSQHRIWIRSIEEAHYRALADPSFLTKIRRFIANLQFQYFVAKNSRWWPSTRNLRQWFG